MRAVVWVDTVQLFIMVAGILAVVIEGSRRLGGIQQVWQIADSGGRINFNK